MKLTCEHQLGHSGFLQLKVHRIPAPGIHNGDGPRGGVDCRFGLTLGFSFEASTAQQEERHSACELELEIVDEDEDRRLTHVSAPSSLSPGDSTGVGAQNITNITGVQVCGKSNM